MIRVDDYDHVLSAISLEDVNLTIHVFIWYVKCAIPECGNAQNTSFHLQEYKSILSFLLPCKQHMHGFHKAVLHDGANPCAIPDASRDLCNWTAPMKFYL